MAQGSAASQDAASGVEHQRSSQIQSSASSLSAASAVGAAASDGWTRLQQPAAPHAPQNPMDAKSSNSEYWDVSTRLSPQQHASVRSSDVPAPDYRRSPACQAGALSKRAAEEQWLQVLRDHFQRQQQELAMMEQQEVKQLRAEHFKQLEKLEYQHYRERDRFESETCRQQVEQMEQQQREELRHLQQLYEGVKRKLPIKQEEYLRHVQVQMQQGQCQTRQVCSCVVDQTMETQPTATTASHRSKEELEELESIAQLALRSMLGAKSPTNESNSVDASRGEPSTSFMTATQPEGITIEDHSRTNAILSQLSQEWTGSQQPVAKRRRQNASDSFTGLRKLEPNTTISTQQFKDQSAPLRFKLPTLTQMQQPRIFRA